MSKKVSTNITLDAETKAKAQIMLPVITAVIENVILNKIGCTYIK